MHTSSQLQDIQVNLKTKLAALWTSFMFLYIYVDYFHLFMPDVLKEMLAGKVFMFHVSQNFLLIVLTTVTIPAVMIFLSMLLPAKVNRYINLIVATVYIPYSLFNLVGQAWIHMVFAAIVEVLILSIIIRFAWKWPRG